MMTAIDVIYLFVALILIYVLHEIMHLFMSVVTNDKLHGFLVGLTNIGFVMGLLPDGKPSPYTQLFPAVLIPLVWFAFPIEIVREALTTYTALLTLMDVLSYNIMPKLGARITTRDLDLYGILITSRYNNAIHMYKGNKIAIGSLVIAYGKLS